MTRWNINRHEQPSNGTKCIIKFRCGCIAFDKQSFGEWHYNDVIEWKHLTNATQEELKKAAIFEKENCPHE